MPLNVERTSLEQWAKAAASELRSADAHDVNIDLPSISRRRGISRIVESDMERDALLLPEQDGFVVKVRRVDNSTQASRRRWSIAHEIAHTFFYSLESGYPKRTWPRDLPKDASEERVCDLVAEYLLMPAEQLKQLAQERRASVASLWAIAQQLQVSSRAAARALSERELWRFVAILIKRTNDHRQPYAVEWAVTPRDYWIQNNRHVHCESPKLARCMAGRSTLESGRIELFVGDFALLAEHGEFASVTPRRFALGMFDLACERNHLLPRDLANEQPIR